MAALTPETDICETSSQNISVDAAVVILGNGSIVKIKSSEAVEQLPLPVTSSVSVT